MGHTLIAGYFQFDPVFGDVRGNLRTVVRALEQEDGVDLVVLPELPFTGYSFRDRAELALHAEDPRESDTVDALITLCRKKGMHLVTGFAERAGRRLFNSSLLLGPEGIVSIYRKIHLFMNERLYFDPGDAPPGVHDIGGARVGMMICFDWVYPEMARILALRGADLICHPSNLVLPHCQRAMPVRCMENSVYAITANRFGTEERPGSSIRFTGGSIVAGPGGEEIHRAPPDEVEFHAEPIDPDLSRDKRMTPENDLLADRRPELYGELCSERKDPV